MAKLKLAGGNGFHPYSLAQLHAAGVRDLESFSYDVDTRYTPEAWRGRIRASVGVAASLSPDQVAAFDAEHAQVLSASFPQDMLIAPHRVFVVVGTKQA